MSNPARFCAMLLLLLLNFLLIPQPLSAAVLTQVASTQSEFDCNSVEQIPVAECEILLTLYESTGGGNWLNTEGWLQTNNPCEWYGLQCDQSEHITRIFLDNNQLAGSIPPEIGDFPELTWLQLNDNQLTGSIPSSLGQLTQVVWLRLELNDLSGSIPPELGNMTALEHLMLSGNNLSGPIPAELGKLPAAVRFYLGDMPLSGEIPAELGNLSKLEFLLIDDTELTGPLPQTFRKLESLLFFHLLGTDLCEPADEAFQAWIAGVDELFGDRTLCRSDRPNSDIPNTDTLDSDTPSTETTLPPRTSQPTNTMVATVQATSTGEQAASVTETPTPFLPTDLPEPPASDSSPALTIAAFLLTLLGVLTAGVSYGWWIGQRRS